MNILQLYKKFIYITHYLLCDLTVHCLGNKSSRRQMAAKLLAKIKVLRIKQINLI